MLAMPTPEQALRLFQEDVFLRDAKWDDDSLIRSRSACLMLGVFRTPQQRQEDAIAFEAEDKETFPDAPKWATNRGYFNLLIEDAIGRVKSTVTTPGSREHKKKEDDLKKLEECLLYGDPAEPKKFSTAERRGLREFGKWLLLSGCEDLFVKLTDPRVWSVGDYKRICDFSNSHSAQGAVRGSIQNASELKDDKVRDLGVEGPWKSEWAAIKGYTDVLKDNVTGLWKLRNMQKSARTPADFEALQKEADSTEVKAGSFVAEDESIESRTARFAIPHGDLTEYARLSPNWDNKIQWVKIPEGLSVDQTDHVKRRIQELARDRKTVDFAAANSRTVEEAATLREVFFRAKPLVDSLSEGLVIKWEDVWDNLTDGPKLVDLLMEPSSRHQALSMGARLADKTSRGILGAQIEIIPKRFGIRLASLAAALAIAGIVMIIGVWVSLPGKEAAALVVFFISWFAADQWVQTALRQRNERKLYLGAAAIIGGLIFMVVLADWQQQTFVFPAYDRSYLEYLGK